MRVPLHYETLAGAHDTESEVQQLLQNVSGPRLELKKTSGVTIEVYCDTSSERGRTAEFQKFTFTYVHGLPHPEELYTVKSTTE